MPYRCFKQIILWYCLLYACMVNAQGDVVGIRVWASPENTRVVLDLSDEIKYKLFSLDHPNRLVLDLDDTQFKAEIDEIMLIGTAVKRIRHARRGTSNWRVVFDLSEAVKPNSFLLSPNGGYGNRLVLDLALQSEPQTKVKPKKQPDPVAKSFLMPDEKQLFTVAIDAGHGGDDPGAIGRKYKTKEKDIVLKVARKLEQLIDNTPGMQAFLVREGDYYVGLRKRMVSARVQKADLFISLHADSFKDSRANGASVYVVSERGASSEAAKWLAERENGSDLAGGVSLDDKSDILASVLLDLSQTASQVASFDVANQVLRQIGSVTKLHKKKVQRAGFVVLKSPDIPSILVELGFISNARGEAKLRKDGHQHKLANAIFNGVNQYYIKYHRSQDLPGVPWKLIAEHRVRPGDSLSLIANKYKISVEDLRRANALKSDKLLVGQKLTVPKQGS